MIARAAALAFVLIVGVVGYVLLLHRSPLEDFPVEKKFGETGSKGSVAHVYIEPVSVNAVGDTMQIRVSVFAPSAQDDTHPAAPDRDFSIVIVHDDAVERIEVRANELASPTTIDLNLDDGDVKDYPLDAYRAGLWVRCFEKSATPDAPAILLPTEVTVWQRVLGFRLSATERTNERTAGSNLIFEIRRSFAIVFFVLAAYGAMLVLACGALTIGTMTFLGVRRAEATLMGALAGIVFALPALRNAFPGGAPLGVTGDIFVFLWAELAAVVAIALLIFTWARTGPRP